jgi:hypothetical protein
MRTVTGKPTVVEITFATRVKSKLQFRLLRASETVTNMAFRQ